MKPTIVILAAGASSRMGTPKALAEFRGEVLVERAVRIAGGVGTPIVVVGELDPEKVLEVAPDAEVVVNERWRDGMSASIAAGVRAAAPGKVCVWAVDQPMVTSADLAALVAAVDESDAAAASHAGQPGIPASFSPRLREQLLQLTGDRGARDLLRSDDYSVVTLDGIDARDADTAGQLEELERGAGR